MDTSIETAKEAILVANERADGAEKLLLTACRSLHKLTAGMSATKASEFWGPQLLEWWAERKENSDEAARRVLLSLPDSDIEVLNEYFRRHGQLPTSDWR
jgi:hypothetical protein